MSAKTSVFTFSVFISAGMGYGAVLNLGGCPCRTASWNIEMSPRKVWDFWILILCVIATLNTYWLKLRAEGVHSVVQMLSRTKQVLCAKKKVLCSKPALLACFVTKRENISILHSIFWNTMKLKNISICIIFCILKMFELYIHRYVNI